MDQKRQFLLYAIAASFVALSLFILASGGVSIGLMGLAFFGGCGVVFLAQRAEVMGRDHAARRRSDETNAAAFYFNHQYLGLMALGSALMGTGAALMGLLGAPHWLAWSGAALGFGGAVVLARRATDSRPIIVIHAEGIFHRNIMRTPLRWDYIEMLEISQPASVPYLILHPREGVAIDARTTSLRIHDMQLDGSLADILAAIHHFRPQIIIGAPDT